MADKTATAPARPTFFKMVIGALKKGSVVFDAAPGETNPLFTSVYMMRDAAAKQLGVTDLDKIKEIEVSVKVVS